MNTNQKLVLFGGGALVAATFCPNMYCVGFFVVIAVFVAVHYCPVDDSRAGGN